MTDIQDLNPGQIRQLLKAQELEAFRDPIDPAGPWAKQAQWAQRAGLIGIKLEKNQDRKISAKVVVTESGKAILEQYKELAR